MFLMNFNLNRNFYLFDYFSFIISIMINDLNFGFLVIILHLKNINDQSIFIAY